MQEAARHYFAGERNEAARCCHVALLIQPRDFEALHLLGVLDTDAGNTTQAIERLRRAIELRPEVAQVHYHLGNALRDLGQHEEAEASYAAALARQPDHADALNNRGNALRVLGRYDEAIACYRAALAVRPDFAAAHYNLGRTLAVYVGPEAAIDSLRAALEGTFAAGDAAHLADVYGELGRALLALDRVEEALETCHALRARLPDEPAAAWNESLALLALGRYHEGWAKYELRFLIPRMVPRRPRITCSRWTRLPAGASSSRPNRGAATSSSSVDMHELARRGAQVVIETYPDLVTLLGTLDGIAEVVEDQLPTVQDVTTLLLSLPMAFGTEVETIPAEVPYLRAPDDRLARWRDRLGPRERPRIGVAWWGSAPSRPSSMPVTALAPLLRQPGIEFHALQKELPDEHRAWLVAGSVGGAA